MTTELDDARNLVRLYDEQCRMTSDLASDKEHITGARIDAVLTKGAELTAACEAFRRRYYPRRGRVIVGLWAVSTVSKTGRSARMVLDLFDEYRPKAAS